MCFSTTADVVAGGVLVPVAVLSLRQVTSARELPLAALPAIFALHQFIEAFVWAGADGDVSSGVAHAAAVGYVLIALPLLPILFPRAVWLLEPHDSRRRMVPFVVLGAIVSAHLGYVVAAHGVSVTPHEHALSYNIGMDDSVLWTALYVLAIVGTAALSRFPMVVAFGLLNLVGLTVVALAYAEAFASLWCVYAALSSALILVHLIQRRRVAGEGRDTVVLVRR
ncbi:MAG: DUF6629 family protein [Jatrophihabitans sp.]|uniref:DUF6629 family protein n=1 Tax=Jatrophihabitans sp. TaxID=1932789 RepID=UPI003910D2EB